MAEGAERRRFTRVASGQRCWCEAGEVTLYAQMGNLSEGGVFIRTFAPLRAGTNARLRFGITGESGEVEADAVVVWRCEHANGGPVGMGLKFLTIEPEALSRIRSFVTRESGADTGEAVV